MGKFYHLYLPDYWPGEVEESLSFHNTHIVARHEWGAKKPRYRQTTKGLLSTVRYRYTNTDQCKKAEDCMKIVLDLQLKHMRQGYPDIQYNYLIGGDDNFYEGAGWRNTVKDIENPEEESEEKSRFLILAYIGSEEEISRDRIWKKHMEKQAQKLLSWALENKMIEFVQLR